MDVVRSMLLRAWSALVLMATLCAHAPTLANPLNDAADIGVTLERLDFSVPGERLEPLWYGSLSSPGVYLAQAPAPVAAPSAAAAQVTAELLAAEREFWASVKASEDPADIRAYLEQFPDGVFAALARNRLKRLGEAAAPQAPQVTAAPAAPTQEAAPVRSASPEFVEEALGLTRTQRVLVQRGLTALGFDVGAADGILGARTRAGIRKWQSSRSEAATGHLDAVAVETLLKAGEAVPPEPQRIVVREAVELLSEALSTARAIDDAHSRARALNRVAEAQASAGDTRGSAQTVSEALSAARSIERALFRARALSRVTEAQASAGDIQVALSTARSIHDASFRAWALSRIAKAQASAGDTRGSAQTISEALSIRRSMDRALSRARALSGIADAQASAGDTRGAAQTISEALSTARSIERAFSRALALSSIAEAQASAGDIQVALSTARSIEDALSRALALSGIAETQASAGDTRGAGQTVSEALSTTRSIQDAPSRTLALSRIAEPQASAGDTRGVAQTVSEALSTARSIKNASSRALGLSRVAKAQARAGDIQVALSTARSIEDAFSRASALSGIAEAQLDAANVRSESGAGATKRVAANSDSTTGTLTYESGNNGQGSGGRTWGGFLYGFGSVGTYYALVWNAGNSEAAFSSLTKACREKTGFECWPRHKRDDIWFPDHVILFSSGGSKKIISEWDHVFQARARCGLVYQDDGPNGRYRLITGTSAKDVEAKYQRQVAEDREYYGENYAPTQHRKIIQRCNDT